MTQVKLGNPAGGESLTIPSFREVAGVVGHGFWELFDEDGNLKDRGEFTNLITQVGDQYYGERAAGIASPPAQVTGMQLGAGSTAAAKTGAGAAIVTLLAASLVAIDSGFPTSALSGSARRIQWKTTYPAGTATTASPITEVALVNQSTGTQTAAPAANTIARAVFTTAVPSKAAGDSLAVTWNNDVLGA